MDLSLKKEYLIFDITKSVTKDGRSFIKMMLSDENGALTNSIMFDSDKLAFSPAKGDIVMVKGVLHSYNEQLQLKVSEMEHIDSKGDLAFMPKSKFSADEMLADLMTILKDNITDVHLKKLYESFINDEELFIRFKDSTAAKSFHHAYIHGLLEHTLSVCRLALILSDYYNNLNREILLIGSLFHDIGKIYELDMSPGFDYTESGRLLGHLMIGYMRVSGYIDKIEGFPDNLKNQILHLIASHHGLLEYGSPQLPKTIEAVMLHFIDDMDAKMNAIDSLFSKESIEKGAWSGFDRLLARQFYKTY